MSIVQKLQLSSICIVSILNKFLVYENKEKKNKGCRDQDHQFGCQRKLCFRSTFVDNSSKTKGMFMVDNE